MGHVGDQEGLSSIELFDALGHPLRVKIIEILNASPLGFADLKRKVGVESSGHLTFHLNKLSDLVKIDNEGNYGLTYEGKEALRLLDTVGEARYKAYHSPTTVNEWYRQNKKVLAIALLVLVITGLSIYSYSSYSNQQYWIGVKNTNFRINAMWIQTRLEIGLMNIDNSYYAIRSINQGMGRLYELWDASSISDSYSLFIGYTMEDFSRIESAMTVIGERIFYGNYTQADFEFLNQSVAAFKYFYQSIPMDGNNGYTLANFDTNVANFHNLSSMGLEIIYD